MIHAERARHGADPGFAECVGEQGGYLPQAALRHGGDRRAGTAQSYADQTGVAELEQPVKRRDDGASAGLVELVAQGFR